MGYSHLEEARGVTATYTQQGTAIPNVIVIPRTSEGDRVPAGKVGMNLGWSYFRQEGVSRSDRSETR